MELHALATFNLSLKLKCAVLPLDQPDLCRKKTSGMGFEPMPAQLLTGLDRALHAMLSLENQFQLEWAFLCARDSPDGVFVRARVYRFHHPSTICWGQDSNLHVVAKRARL